MYLYNQTLNSNDLTITVAGVPKTTPTVTVTPSATKITTLQSINVSVAVSPATGNPTPTGTVTLASGNYVSSRVSLVGGVASIPVPAGALAISIDTLTVTYSGDYNYNSSTGSNTVTVTAPPKTTPAIFFSPPTATITVSQILSEMITVATVSGYPIPTGSVTLSSGNYTSAVQTLGSTGSTVVTVPKGALAVGADTLTATYTGDNSYNPSTASAQVTVNDPTFAMSGTAVTIAPGAATGNISTITVTPSGTFTGSVNLTAQLTTIPPGALYAPILSFGSTSPVNITGTSAVTARLTISTTAPATALAHPLRRGIPLYAAGEATLACIVLFGIPRRRRGWRAFLASVSLFLVLSSGMLACSGGGKDTTVHTSNPGTTPGTYVATVTGTSGTTTVTALINITVQ